MDFEHGVVPRSKSGEDRGGGFARSVRSEPLFLHGIHSMLI